MGDDEKKFTDPFRRPPPLPVHDTPQHQIHLDLLAYIADRENSTSACGELSNGLPIRVTLCTAPPPHVSYICVWCPGQKSDETPHISRCVLEAADSDLVFLYVALHSVLMHCDCFVYKANNDGRGPSLRRLELPDSYMSTHHDIGLLRHVDVVSPQAERGGGRFRLFPDEEDQVAVLPHGEPVVFRPFKEGAEDAFPHAEGGVVDLGLSQHEEAERAVFGQYEDGSSFHLPRSAAGERFLLRRHGEGDSDFYVALLRYKRTQQHNFELCVFHSKDEQWRYMPFSLSGHGHHISYKAINLGQGGLVAFADPWRGIIVCDVLGRRPPLYLPLPAELISDHAYETPLLYRDIALVEGHLTIVELCDIDVDNRQTWEVSTWSRKVTDLWEEDWSKHNVVHSDDISLKDAAGVDLLPKVMDDDGSIRPTLEMPYIAHPTLSLTDSPVVYVMGKVGYFDKKVLVMSVDMKERRLLEVTMFNAERMVGVPFGYTYMQSLIPRYFNPGVGRNLKRPGMFRTTYPHKLHAGINALYNETLQISRGVQEQHDSGSSMGAEHMDSTMDMD